MLDDPDFNRSLFYPRRDSSAAPAGAVDLGVSVPGAELHLRWYRSDLARATLLLFHGNGEVVADYDPSAPAFARAGAELAIVDYRGYGRSTGTPSLRAIVADAALVLKTLAEHSPRPIIVMGRSLGSACAIDLYGRVPERVAGFILESGFVDLDEMVDRRGKSAAAIGLAEREEFDPAPKLKRGRHPLLVLHGAQDDLIAPSEAERAFALAGTNDKKLKLIEGRGHNDISDSDAYWDAIASFVESRASDA
jgi:pimeloyl-ACP methyl ester carboxylesterase